VAKSNIGISWTNEAMNSLVGCQECSRGCESCYARMRIYRFSKCSATNHDNGYSDLVEIARTPGSRAGTEDQIRINVGGWREPQLMCPADCEAAEGPTHRWLNCRSIMMELNAGYFF